MGKDMVRSRTYSQSSIYEDMKQPIKWMELPIMKFNEVAVPHHVAQLKQLKINIQKCARNGDYQGMRKEELNASKVVKQLRTLVREMDSLRNKVVESDLKKFDKSINYSRQAALAALMDYKSMLSQLPSTYPENENKKNGEQDGEQQIQASLQIQASVEVSRLADDIRMQERRAIELEELQNEIEEVHELFVQLAQLVETQGESVTIIERNVEETETNVVEGERFLSQAAKLKVPSYGLAGAIIGTCVAGPVGFVAGLKLGSLAAVAGSFLGFTGGQILKSKHQSHIETEQRPATAASVPENCQAHHN